MEEVISVIPKSEFYWNIISCGLYIVDVFRVFTNETLDCDII
jgi:hypothetical protein